MRIYQNYSIIINMSFLNVLYFVLGMFAQAYSMLLGKWQEGDIKKLLIAFGTGFFGMVPGKHERNYELNLHVFYSCIIAASTFTSVFNHRLISRVGARALLILNILLIFLIYIKFGFSYFIFGLIFIPSLITLINGFSNLDDSFKWQVFFYVWFSIIIVSIGLLYFAFGSLLQTFGWSDVETTASFSIFMTGAAFLYILSNAWYAIMLIPVTGKHQTLENRMAHVRQHMQLLAYGYVWEKDDWLGNMLAVILLPLLLIVNYHFNFIGMDLVISLILISMPLFSLTVPAVHSDDGIGEPPTDVIAPNLL